MKTQRQKLGKRGEDIAVKYLKKNKYKIVEQNYHAGRYGEIDIIARDRDQIVFIEVKAKTDKQFGSPEQELTHNKKKKLHRAIHNYLFKHFLQDKPWRMDLIAIEIPSAKINLKHYKNLPLYGKIYH